MPAADFVHAVSLLLRDGQLRDDFARDPIAVASRLGLRGGDRDSLVQLDASELERQAEVLLRKRYQRVRKTLPETFARLADSAWHEFVAYSRIHWPQGEPAAELDARGFCRQRQIRPLVSVFEFNRLEFGLSRRRISFAIVSGARKGRLRSPTLQILMRTCSNTLREFQLFLQL